MKQERPDLRVVVYDHSFKGDRAWFRFAFKWTDTKSGGARSRAGMQSYRIEGGKLAETWLVLQPLDSAWTDAAAQEHWTSPPPIKSGTLIVWFVALAWPDWSGVADALHGGFGRIKKAIAPKKLNAE